ncbi:Multidrug efflux pump subunit AcrA (membrane-fusion protein) (AcrA) [Fructobacillus fructosus]|nr:Multidrug efflux pump subunit AcrA (membrane-fusion protein) (AcrA) [Fructobacillus fructosus]CAK1222774.1 Multidrug efflux pump subunit AcrA (membrane-fusion protein) (AcrA) [Fructobacillus fructosus]CAK1222900.1 Multidrug efflux pump subunit AcrA (membrane-fusion protein) (AcrA) [Fructobacillus fructosus]
MIYLFDKKQEIVGMLDKADMLEAKLDLKINTAAKFDLSLPPNKAFGNNVRYVGVPHPLDENKYLMLRLMSVKDSSDKVEYSWYELAYQELGSYSYIKDRRFASETAENLMKVALGGSPWKLGKCNVNASLHTNFYYLSNLEAINEVVKGLGGEIVFYVSISGNKVTGRYMDYVTAQGVDTSKVFVHGSNLLNVERTGDNSSIYTAILPRGKGEQVSEGHDDTPDGYGRRITIEDLDWKKSNNDPLDKPNGDAILVDPLATAEYGHIDGSPRLLIKTYEDIDDKWVLLNTAYRDLMQANHPAYQYSASVTDTDGLSLGDTVLIMHNDRDLSYKTRVFEVEYDLITPENTTLQLGSDLSNNSITQAMTSISSTAQSMSNTLSWTMSHGGNNDTTFGPKAPASPRKGNVWYKQLDNGTTELYYWNGNAWVLSAKTDSQWQKNRAEQSGDHTRFDGPDEPKNAQQGDIWFKEDVNEKNGIAMYSYSGTTWVKFNGMTDANMLQEGRIDASRINVLNLDAGNITAGNLSANFIKGGQIDASQIDVINLNVNSLVGNVSQFIKSNWNGEYQSVSIEWSGMTISTGDMKTSFNNYGINFDYRGRSIGYIGRSTLVGNDNVVGMSFNLDSDGDYFSWSAKDKGNPNGNYPMKMAWYRQGLPNTRAGFVFSDDVNFNNAITIRGSADVSGMLATMAYYKSQGATFVIPTSVGDGRTIGSYVYV